MQNSDFVDLVNDILKDADKREHFFQVCVIVLLNFDYAQEQYTKCNRCTKHVWNWF